MTPSPGLVFIKLLDYLFDFSSCDRFVYDARSKACGVSIVVWCNSVQIVLHIMLNLVIIIFLLLFITEYLSPMLTM